MTEQRPDTRHRPIAIARQASANDAARRVLVVLAALVLAVAAAVWGAATAASAHDELVSSTPADGDSLESAPTEAVLEFSGNVQEVGTEFALQDASGATVELPEAYTISGTSISQPLPELEHGEYSLNWRVVSEDGHPISGTIGFGVGSTLGGGASTADAGQFQNQPVDPNDVDVSASSDSGTNPWLVGIMSFVGVLVIGGAAVIIVMRMRRGNTPGGQTPAAGEASSDAHKSPDTDA
ncbi:MULTISPECIES: copper resistance protein CopC [Gulosibacter]|uniref:copper resistance CopC family protein n=1 Tax=Gulosibacter TaxID=256818 RepID=UPI000F63ED37|nr:MULTISPECIES: copper resistance CopC family protein [Gulosibacter]